MEKKGTQTGPTNWSAGLQGSSVLAGGQVVRQGQCVKGLKCQAKLRHGPEPASHKMQAAWFAVSISMS